KRTTLSSLVRRSLDSIERWAWLRRGLLARGRLYMGHTRFATSSKATLEGTHPHRWTPPQTQDVYVGWSLGHLTKQQKRLELFITHNGDLDYFDVGKITYDLGTIQSWLEHATGCARPADVDSAAIAGIMDLLRTQGCLTRSVRFGFLFGPKRTSLNYEMPAQKLFKQIGQVIDGVLQRHGIEEKTVGILNDERELLRASCVQAVVGCKLQIPLEESDVQKMVNSSVDAFFDNDLLFATQLFMRNAKGSFGLCITSSLDASRQMVIAARGQTMSVAFYPETGLVLYGSEAAAVKAGMGKSVPHEQQTQRRSRHASVVFGLGSKARGRSDSNGMFHSPDKLTFDASHESMQAGGSNQLALQSQLNEGYTKRIAAAIATLLKDLGGEICLLDWGEGMPFTSFNHRSLRPTVLMNNALTVTLVRESFVRKTMMKRMVAIEDNPLVLPLPRSKAEPVGQDIQDIPKALEKIQNDWDLGRGLNRSTAWALGRALRGRLQDKLAGKVASDAVDLLITGCEVSLWLGEQLAADLSLCFRRLVVRCISANKILGLHGLECPMPQTGHGCGSWNLQGACVLLVSHSGGSFSTLNISNLLQAATRHLFIVTSEWDTQIGKQLRQLDETSRIFSTDIGLRPAEPCSIS
ncbi:unnamed protein product, partial [Symbiodinium pilosum]